MATACEDKLYKKLRTSAMKGHAMHPSRCPTYTHSMCLGLGVEWMTGTGEPTHAAVASITTIPIDFQTYTHDAPRRIPGERSTRIRMAECRLIRYTQIEQGMSQMKLIITRISTFITANEASLRFFCLERNSMVGMPDNSKTRSTMAQNTDARSL